MENVLVSSALYIVISVTILELILGILFFIEYRKAKDPLTFCFAMAAPLTGMMDLLFIFSILGEVFMSFFFYLFIKKEYRYGT